MRHRMTLRLSPAALTLVLLGAQPAAAQIDAVDPFTSVDEVVDAVAACLAATTSKYVNIETLADSGWRIGTTWGDTPALRIYTFNKSGSNASIRIVSVGNSPSVACRAIGRFPSEHSFAEFDTAFEALMARPADKHDTAIQDTGNKTEISSWTLEHNSIDLSHFYGRNSVTIAVRYR